MCSTCLLILFLRPIMHSKKKILIADDEQDILDILRYNLESEGFQVETVSNGISAIETSKTFLPDLIILDVMMPFKNGVDTCRELRKLPAFKQTLIVFLSAMNDEVSEISGLESGADDYLTKPIRPKALISKVQSLFRRLPEVPGKDLNLGSLKINRENFTVSIGEHSIVLARKEFELLFLLASKPGKVFLRQEILQMVWGTDVIVGDRTIDVHIRKIRQKLDQDIITTVKGVGYKFELNDV